MSYRLWIDNGRGKLSSKFNNKKHDIYNYNASLCPSNKVGGVEGIGSIDL